MYRDGWYLYARRGEGQTLVTKERRSVRALVFQKKKIMPPSSTDPSSRPRGQARAGRTTKLRQAPSAVLSQPRIQALLTALSWPRVRGRAPLTAPTWPQERAPPSASYCFEPAMRTSSTRCTELTVRMSSTNRIGAGCTGELRWIHGASHADELHEPDA
jgi:hypothetical protein